MMGLVLLLLLLVQPAMGHKARRLGRYGIPPAATAA